MKYMVEKNSCQLFDTGRFNDIAYAYMVCAMREAGTPLDEAGKILEKLGRCFDELTAEQALARFRGE